MATANVGDNNTLRLEAPAEPQMITRSQTKKGGNDNILRETDEDISFRTPKNISEDSDLFRRVFAKQDEKIERMRADSLQRDARFLNIIQDLTSKLDNLGGSQHLNSTVMPNGTRPRVHSHSTIHEQASMDRLNNSSDHSPTSSDVRLNPNGGIPQRPIGFPPPGFPPPRYERPVPNQAAFGPQEDFGRNHRFPHNNFGNFNRNSRDDQHHNRSVHRVVYHDIDINGTEKLSIDYLPASVVDVKSTRPGAPLMMCGGIVLPDVVPSGTNMKLISLLLDHENEYYKGKAIALQYLKDAILSMHPNWNVIGNETSNLDLSNTSMLNTSGDQSKLAMEMVKRQQIPSDVYFDGLNDLDDYFETCESYMIGLPSEARAIMLRRGFRGEALAILKELPPHLAFDDASIKEHFRSFYAKSQTTRYKDKFENMQLKAGMSYSWFAHNLRAAYIADNPTAIHRLVEKIVKVQFLRKIPKGTFDHISGYYDMDTLTIAEILDKTKAYKKIVYTNSNLPTAKVMVADSQNFQKNDYSSSSNKNYNQSGNRQGRSRERPSYPDKRYHSNGFRNNDRGRSERSDDRRSPSGDRRNYSNDRYDRTNVKHFSGDKSSRSNDRHSHYNGRNNHSSDRRDHSNDRRNNNYTNRDYSPNNRSLSRDRSRDRSPGDRKFNSYRGNSPYRNRDNRLSDRSRSASPIRQKESGSGNSRPYNKDSSSGNPRTFNSSRGTSPRRTKDNMECWFCGKKGHFASECWSKVQKKLYSVMQNIDDSGNVKEDTEVSPNSLNA